MCAVAFSSDRLSKYIRSKGAHDSESSPILGSDPLHYASMAANVRGC
jgi:hypothetical protein